MARLFVIRHAEAEQLAPTDAERPLSARGRLQCEAVAQHLIDHCFHQGDALTLFHSPYVRTTQTMKIVTKQLIAAKVSVDIEENRLLVEAGKMGEIVDWLESRLSEEQLRGDGFSICLVSHQPIVSRLLEWLVNGQGSAKSSSGFPMMPASVAELNVDILAKGCARLMALTHFDA